ncbi:glycosyl transferase GT2 family [Apostichopus japonicus]|uniref:Glycosyl transferase GT2 family n=1 Tax=Stichopus japonicus TaxID=307972 RepID=A0A2G8JJV3_STIJA|nr:glycosyl transferase GT2 family [Apostichopus japonicus]
MIGKKDCQKLLDYLKVPAKESKDIIKSGAPFSSLVHHLREAGKTTEEERQQLTGRLKASEEERQQLTGRLKASEEERQQLNDTLKATEEERQKLTGRLKTTEEEKQHFSDRLNTTENKLKTLKDEKEELLQQRKEELEKAKSSLRATKIELVKSQLEYAKEVMALQEVLKQRKEALHQQALAPSASVTEEETVLEEHEALDISHESTLAADYGRLKVQVADDLTLDSCVKLATLFRLPPAETDMLRRVSLIETPGITLITSWIEKVKFDPDDESTPSQGSDEREDDHDHSKESLMEKEERELPKQSKDSRNT